MMNDSTYLLFKLNEFFFGIDLSFIQEILEIPELERPPETSSQLVGFLNFHGKIIEVLDLAILLDFPKMPYSVNDFVVVLNLDSAVGEAKAVQGFESESLLIGAEHSQKVNPIKSSYDSKNSVDLTSPTAESRLKGSSFCFGLIVRNMVNIHTLSNVTEISETQQASFLSSNVAHFDDQLVLILDPNLLIKKLDILFGQAHTPLSPEITQDCQMNEQDRKILSSRSQNLKRPSADDRITEPLIPLMIVTLEQHYFGIDPETIREFIPINDFNPIPQAPPYLLGCLGFKGYVLTLLDIWPILKMQKLRIAPDSQALILNSLMVGIVVDKVVDLIYIHSTDLQPVPTGIEGTPFQSFTKHVVAYDEKILSILDIPKILESMNNGDKNVKVLESPQN